MPFWPVGLCHWLRGLRFVDDEGQGALAGYAKLKQGGLESMPLVELNNRNVIVLDGVARCVPCVQAALLRWPVHYVVMLCSQHNVVDVIVGRIAVKMATDDIRLVNRLPKSEPRVEPVNATFFAIGFWPKAELLVSILVC